MNIPLVQTKKSPSTTFIVIGFITNHEIPRNSVSTVGVMFQAGNIKAQ